MLRYVIIFLLAVPSLSYADTVDKQLAKCAVIKGELARLVCFDKIAKSRGLNGPQNLNVPASEEGNWIVNSTVNPIDDSKTVFLGVESSNAKNSWGKKVSLIIRCKSNTTELYILWNDYLGSKADVLTRVGKGEPSTDRWSMSTDSKATFFPKPVIPFIKKLLKHDKLVAQVTPYNDNPITAVFDLTGIENAIGPLRETCSW